MSANPKILPSHLAHGPGYSYRFADAELRSSSHDYHCKQALLGEGNTLVTDTSSRPSLCEAPTNVHNRAQSFPSKRGSFENSLDRNTVGVPRILPRLNDFLHAQRVCSFLQTARISKCYALNGWSPSTVLYEKVPHVMRCGSWSFVSLVNDKEQLGIYRKYFTNYTPFLCAPKPSLSSRLLNLS